MKHAHHYKKISEFRKDIISKDWILVVKGRRNRPGAGEIGKHPKKRKSDPLETCPFENPQKKNAAPPVLWYPHPGAVAGATLKNWFLRIISNKYPAVAPHHICPVEISYGPYSNFEGIGFHEVIITRDHRRSIADMSKEEVDVILHSYQERYIALENEPCIRYILIFHNHGKSAGASLTHPHSQLIAIPIIPPDVGRSLSGYEKYFKKHHTCGHCAGLRFEKKEEKRIVYENKKFITIAPYAPRVSSELRIFPKKHSSHFERITTVDRMELADALFVTLRKLKKGMDDPDYNFFIHTAPAKTDGMNHYHWHIEILPRFATWAGVELGTGVEVVAVSPEETAKQLKNIRV